MRRTLFLLVALAALTACNPRLYPPQVETPDNYLYAGLFRQDSLAGSEEWWHVFRDPTLDSLISQALAEMFHLFLIMMRPLAEQLFIIEL